MIVAIIYKTYSGLCTLVGEFCERVSRSLEMFEGGSMFLKSLHSYRLNLEAV